jgi:hypothetical protein
MINHADFKEYISRKYRNGGCSCDLANLPDLDKLASLSSINLEEIQKLTSYSHILPGHNFNFTLRLPKNDIVFSRQNRQSILDSATKSRPFLSKYQQPAEVSPVEVAHEMHKDTDNFLSVGVA